MTLRLIMMVTMNMFLVHFVIKFNMIYDKQAQWILRYQVHTIQ